MIQCIRKHENTALHCNCIQRTHIHTCLKSNVNNVEKLTPNCNSLHWHGKAIAKCLVKLSFLFFTYWQWHTDTHRIQMNLNIYCEAQGKGKGRARVDYLKVYVKNSMSNLRPELTLNLVATFPKTYSTHAEEYQRFLWGIPHWRYPLMARQCSR